MSSLITTMQTESNWQFAKNVIGNMKDSLTLPFWAVKILDKDRRAIYWKLYAKHIDSPNWYENDEHNIFILKEFIKFCPYYMAEDYIGFAECWEEDQDEVHKIDCSKIKRQYNKVLPIIEKIKKVRLEMKLSLKDAVKMVEFVDWITNNDNKLNELYVSYKRDTGAEEPFMQFAEYIFKQDKNIINWHKSVA